MKYKASLLRFTGVFQISISVYVISNPRATGAREAKSVQNSGAAWLGRRAVNTKTLGSPNVSVRPVRPDDRRRTSRAVPRSGAPPPVGRIERR
ncbi:protein of unknown function [Burkholderia multivorans]